MTIRAANIADSESIRQVHTLAFPEDESPSIVKLALDLLSEPSNPETISLVADIEGTVAGHTAFSPAQVQSHPDFLGYILAPLGVHPEYQGQRVGSAIVEHGLRLLSERGVHVAFVYGDPNYYGRFGFSQEVAQFYAPPYALKMPFGWQALVLNESGLEGFSEPITCVAPLCDPELW